jgi:hypothetical protein
MLSYRQSAAVVVIVVELISMLETPIMTTLFATMLAPTMKTLVFELFVWLEFTSREPVTWILPRIVRTELAGLA